MDPILIEARCNLAPDDPQWSNIASISLEIGYKGLNGKTIWKQIGWLHDRLRPSGRTFAHALWKSSLSDQILVFDFLPLSPSQPLPYRIRKRITSLSGQSKTQRTGVLRGDYTDEHLSLHPIAF